MPVITTIDEIADPRIEAYRDMANLGLTLSATGSIVDQIEASASGAFYRDLTAAADKPEGNVQG